jgi:tetraacyldisaccharide 4'-kinase
LEQWITRQWQGRGVWAWLLLPLALLYGALSGMRRMAYRRGWLQAARMPVPVVVVGNIFVGGTGKTPLVIGLVQALQAAGWRPGVISRGHAGAGEAGDASKVGNTVRPVGPQDDPAQVGDEPVLIATHCGCPVMVGRKRVLAARALLAAHPEVNILLTDDGLQHYALQRDVEVMLFDQRGVGNGWLLPAGPLREPVARRADFVVCNGGGPRNPCHLPPPLASHPAQFAMQLVPGRAYALHDPAQKRDLHDFAGRGLAAAGIGHPERFFAMLRQAGLVFDSLPLPDHHAFDDNPFAATRAEWILLTEKDAVKCRRQAALQHDARLWVVPVTAQFDAALVQQILEKCGGRSFT